MRRLREGHVASHHLWLTERDWWIRMGWLIGKMHGRELVGVDRYGRVSRDKSRVLEGSLVLLQWRKGV